MKRNRRFFFLLLAFGFWLATFSLADTCTIPFPQNVTYPYGIKPNNFTNAQMNAHVQAWFDKWRAKYVTQNGCTGAEWRLQRTETGNMITKGCSENDTVSEGIGYGMVIMAYMSSATNNTKQYFDGMYTYYKNHLDGSGLMNWQIPYCDSGGSATDADEDVAFALLVADKQWGNATGTNYHNEANTIIGRILGSEINGTNDVRPGDGWDGGNISYFAPYEYRMFGDHTSTARWYTVASHTYQTIVNYYYNSASTLNAGLGIRTGLQPNWCNYDGTTWSPGAWAMDANSWWWDAIRHAWRQSYDYVLYGTMNGQLAQDNNERLSYFFKTKYGGDASQIKSHYKLDGTETSYNRGDRTPDLGTEDVRNLPGPEGAVAIAAMVEGDQDWLNECYYTLVTMNAGTGSGELTDTGVAWGTDYFCDILKMQYLLILTGNMPNPMGNYPSPTVTPTITIGPSPTPVPQSVFDDFETGALKNPDTSESNGTVLTISNVTEDKASGLRSLKGVTTGGSWAIFSIDSPYDGGLGYRDYTGATRIEFDIKAPTGTQFFIEIGEALLNGGDGERFSNRGNPITTTAAGWQHISILISSMTRDTYTPVSGNNVFNLGGIKSFLLQMDNPGNKTFYIDNISFTGNFPTPTPTYSATRTRTPNGTRTNSPTITVTPTITPYYSPTISPTSSFTRTNTPFISATITSTSSITPTSTLTPNIPFGIFDDFETGALKNPSTTDTGGGSTLTITNSTTLFHAGARSMQAVTGGGGWAVASIDSPYDGGLGYRDFTGATGISFWIYTTSATGMFLKIVESNGQQWSNRGAAITTAGTGWQQFSLALSGFTVDAYSPAGDGDAVFDKNIIKSVQFQWDNPGTKTIYIDDITFTGIPTPTYTPSGTRTRTFTPSATYTRTFTPSPTYSASPTSSPTATNSASASASATRTFTATPSNTYTPTLTATSTATPTLSQTASPTRTATPTFTITQTSTSGATLTSTPPSTNTFTPTYTVTATNSQTATPTNTLTPSPTNTPSATPTFTNTPTRTATPTFTGSFTPSFTATPTYTQTYTATYTVTPTNSISPTVTQSPTGTPPTPTSTPTVTWTSTNVPTSTVSPSRTATGTATQSYTPTFTATPTFTDTHTMTSTLTSTRTPTPTSTGTPSSTATLTYTLTATMTYTLTVTPTNSVSPTITRTPTGTPPTPTSTPTITATYTITASFTATVTPSLTLTRTGTPTVTVSATTWVTPSYSPTGIVPTSTFTRTFTATSTRTRTSTPTVTGTESRVPSPVPTATTTPTLSPTTTHIALPTVSPTLTPSDFTITDPIIYPCPYTGDGSLKLRFSLSRECRSVNFRLYTVSFRYVLKSSMTGSYQGDTYMEIKADRLRGLASGTYYYVVTARTASGDETSSKIRAVIIIK